MTRSMAARRLLDMPTSVGDLTGRPSPALVIVRAVRITLSNANSLDYLNLYEAPSPKVPARAVDVQPREWYRRTVANDSVQRRSPLFPRKFLEFSRKLRL